MARLKTRLFCRVDHNVIPDDYLVIGPLTDPCCGDDTDSYRYILL